MHIIPVHAHVIPVHAHVIPVHAHVIPVHAHVIPVHAHISPVHAHISPVHAHVSPVHAHVIPVHAHVIPVHAHVIPVHAHVIPVHAHVIPVHAHVIPVHAHVSPVHAHIIPTRSNEAQCVEDILREMTHSWPPLLPTVQSPCASQPPRTPPAAQVAEHVQVKPPSKGSGQPLSACSAVKAAHSSGVESASSSDSSESSSGSESDNDSAKRPPLQPPRGSPAELKAQAPHTDWQLAYWIRNHKPHHASSGQEEPSYDHRAEPQRRVKTGGKKRSTKPSRTLSPARPEVKTKAKRSKSRSSKTDSASLPTQKEALKCSSKATVSGPCCPCCGRFPNCCVCPVAPSPGQPDRVAPAPALVVVTVAEASSGKSKHARRQKGAKAPKTVMPPSKPVESAGYLFTSLLVKIDLSRLSRAEFDKNPPIKKQKMEKKAKVVLPGQAPIMSNSAKDEKQQTATKKPASPGPQKKKKNKQQHHGSDPKEPSTDAVPGKDRPPVPKHKKSTKKHKEHSTTGKKAPKSTMTIQGTTEPGQGPSSSRPKLSFEDRHHPVKHYIKEAKKLKHKADTESDKVSRAFGYLEAAMFFAESGVAMETDPETSKSPYSMYEDTLELIKFTLKQKNSGESCPLPLENDFTVLCLKCQSFLLMAMFRCKHKVATKYSKTLKAHFKNSKLPPDPRSTDATASPGSPALTSSSSLGPGSNHSCGGGGEGPPSTTVSIPKVIHHMAASYVSITALFVCAHDVWEKAEALALKSSGVLSELDGHMGPLSLSSSMTSMVRYTRQALHWLRLEAPRLK
ncbi:hypothetical protein NHX12_027923 [Muraenolepis orangiensis]|uniref:AF4/FMR2 C-terminal homology domain-containing protein n=1 Tax=Muraenolepis orangiensis TaxID=630683 RepID=A0A9Q0EEN8_9TELE|nr:hypothetical protein NHX12_027923 [Muraenolepis orangiensis]